MAAGPIPPNLTYEQQQALAAQLIARSRAGQLTPEEAQHLQTYLRNEAWRTGRLRFKLHGNQQDLYDRLELDPRTNKPPRRFFALWTRRGGKSMFGITKAFEVAIRVSGARILYLAPYAKNAKEIVTDQLPKFLQDCPNELRPKINEQQGELVFKNGSIIRFKGVNSEKAEDLRGGFAHLVILDEAGNMDKLSNVMRDVCRPMTSTTKGLILLLTTPPNTPSHDSASIYDELKADGLTFDVTLAQAQNPELDYEEKCLMLKDSGEHAEDIPRILAGEIPPRTVTARREYFCFWETDAGQAMFPEYANAASNIYKDPGPPPPYRDCYVGADWGYRDASGLLFAYWDTKNDRLVIEDEWLEPQAGITKIADTIHAKERELWATHPGSDEVQFDVYRVCDVDPRLRADLNELYGIIFANADKRDKQANIELLRSWIRRGQLVIHPRCKKLDRQLRNAIWDRRGKDFQRMEATEDEEKSDYHFDLASALVYLVRYAHARRKRDPYPTVYPEVRAGQHVSPKHWSNQKPKVTFHDDHPLARRLFGKKRR